MRAPRPWPYGQDLARETQPKPHFHGWFFELGGAFAPPISLRSPLSPFSPINIFNLRGKGAPLQREI